MKINTFFFLHFLQLKLIHIAQLLSNRDKHAKISKQKQFNFAREVEIHINQEENINSRNK